MNNSRKLGRFVINNRDIQEDTETVQAVMAQCVPVRTESLWECDGIEYIAISEHFDSVPHGQIVPEYAVNLSQPEENGPIEVTFTKKG